MKKNLLILALILIVTFVFLYPVFLNINTHIAGFSSTDEPYGVIWSFWWFKTAALQKIPANFINMIAFPFGIDTVESVPFFPLWGLLAKYLSICVNEIFAYNFLLLLTFVLTALSAYALMMELTKNRGVSIFSALIFSFCPYHFVRVWQHFGTAQIQWIPLYIFSLIKLFSTRNIRFAFLLAFSLALNYYHDVHYAYYLFFAGLLFLICVLTAKDGLAEKIRFFKLFLLAMVIGVLLILPALVPFLVKFLQTKHQAVLAQSLVRPFEDLFSQSARPLSYLLPFTEQPVFGGFTKMFIGTGLWGESLTEHNVFLGFIPLSLAILAFIKRKRITELFPYKKKEAGFIFYFFVSLFVLGFIFSQPPWWDIFGFKLYMPSFVFYKIVPMFRAYVRWAIIVMLSVSVLAGFGLLYLVSSLKQNRAKAALIAAFTIFSLWEFWSNPGEHVIDLSRTPLVYDWLSEQPGDFVIAEYPLDTGGANETYKFYQIRHKKKIINGTLPGTLANTFARKMTRLAEPETILLLRRMGVKYVVVHPAEYENTGIMEELEALSNIRKSRELRSVKTCSEAEVYEIAPILRKGL